MQTKFLQKLTFFIFLATQCQAQSWHQLANFPSTERDDGTSFSIGQYAYCGTGLQVGGATTADFYRFDLFSDSWDTVASMPAAAARQYAAGFSHNSAGYVFGGTSSVSLNDLWRYNQTTNNWSQLTSKPGQAVSGAACFSLHGNAVIIGGNNSSIPALNEVWQYTINTDTWEQKSNFPLNGIWRASAVVCDHKAYLIFGRDTAGNLNNKLYQYHEATSTFSVISTFPGAGRMYAAFQSSGTNLIVFGGLDSLGHCYDDLWYYDLLDSTWHQQISLPTTGRKGGMSFVSENSFYYTTGINQQGIRLNETWKIENVISVKELEQQNVYSLFPNPVNSFFEIQTEQNSYSVQLVTNLGAILWTKQGNKHQKFNTSDLHPGIYFLKIEDAKSTVIKKLIVSN